MKANGCGEKTEILSQGLSDAMTPRCPSSFSGCSFIASFERFSSLPRRCPHFWNLSPQQALPFLQKSRIKQIIHQWLSTGHISPRSSLPKYPLPLKAPQLNSPKPVLSPVPPPVSAFGFPSPPIDPHGLPSPSTQVMLSTTLPQAPSTLATSIAQGAPHPIPTPLLLTGVPHNC